MSGGGARSAASGASTDEPRIVLACTTCELTVELSAADEQAVRPALARFFDDHAEHRTWIDVSGARGLPAPAADP